MIATTLHKFSISLMRKQFKAKSIAKNSKQKEFFRSFSFFSISIVSMQDSFNDEKLELFVSLRFETSLFITIFSSRNFIFFSERFRFFSNSEQQTIIQLIQRQKKQKRASFRQTKQERNKQTNTK